MNRLANSYLSTHNTYHNILQAVGFSFRPTLSCLWGPLGIAGEKAIRLLVLQSMHGLAGITTQRAEKVTGIKETKLQALRN